MSRGRRLSHLRREKVAARARAGAFFHARGPELCSILLELPVVAIGRQSGGEKKKDVDTQLCARLTKVKIENTNCHRNFLPQNQISPLYIRYAIISFRIIDNSRLFALKNIELAYNACRLCVLGGIKRGRS